MPLIIRQQIDELEAVRRGQKKKEDKITPMRSSFVLGDDYSQEERELIERLNDTYPISIAVPPAED